MTAWLAANWLRLAVALILLSLLVIVLVEDYRFRHADDAEPYDREQWIP